MSRLGGFVAVTDSGREQSVQAAAHQGQLQVAVDLQGHRRREGVHVEEVDPVLDSVLDQHSLRVAADQLGGRTTQLVGQQHRRGFVPQVGRPAPQF